MANFGIGTLARRVGEAQSADFPAKAGRVGQARSKQRRNPPHRRVSLRTHLGIRQALSRTLSPPYKESTLRLAPAGPAT